MCRNLGGLDVYPFTGAPTPHLEDNTSCIYFIEHKIVTERVKHIDIPVCFIHEQYGNVLFIPKYEKSLIMIYDICTKPCSGPIISNSTKWITGLQVYPSSDSEHYQRMTLEDLKWDNHIMGSVLCDFALSVTQST